MNIIRPESWPMAAMAKQRGIHVLTASPANAELVVKTEAQTPQGLNVHVKYEDVDFRTTLPLVGAFQAENVAISLGLVRASGVKAAKFEKILKVLTSVAGRMEMFKTEGKPLCLVDYAHTPDALRKALNSLQGATKGKLWVIFGCGGNRDVAKRSQMGEIAGAFADAVIVTDDNPRYENADDIRTQILAAVPQAENIGDRKQAISFALKNAEVDDIILIAGKGHEEGQYVAGEVLPYNERKTVKELLG